MSFRIVNFGPAKTGLVTIGYRLVSAGGSLGLRQVPDVQEVAAPSGVYLVSVAEAVDSVLIVWDTGGVSPTFQVAELQSHVIDNLLGPRAVTVNFRGADTNLVPGVVFTVVGLGSGVAASGAAAFGLNDGTYTIRALPTAGVVFPDTPITVSGDGAFDVTGAVPAAPVPPDVEDSQTVLTGHLRDGAGDVWPNGSLSYRLVALPDGSPAVGYRGATKVATADGDGLIQAPILKGAEYLLSIERGEEYSLTAGTAATTDLPPMLGGQTA